MPTRLEIEYTLGGLRHTVAACVYGYNDELPFEFRMKTYRALVEYILLGHGEEVLSTLDMLEENEANGSSS